MQEILVGEWCFYCEFKGAAAGGSGGEGGFLYFGLDI
jgi:hypothetical protein